MKKFSLKACGLILAGIFIAETSNATLITVGEGDTGEGIPVYGNIDGFPLTWHYGTDPSGIVTGESVLYYDIPLGASPGFVYIRDPWEGYQIGDVINFIQPGYLIFYSKGDGNIGSADISDYAFNQVLNYYSHGVYIPEMEATVFEQGNELINWADYAADNSFPGSFDGESMKYKFISDTPEPATIMFMGIGALGMMGMKYTKRRKSEVHNFSFQSLTSQMVRDSSSPRVM